MSSRSPTATTAAHSSVSSSTCRRPPNRLLQLVNVGHKSLGDYGTLVSRGLMDEVRRLAEPLAGKRVVHISATAFGGGVAEINYTLVPLMRDAGLEAEWRTLRGAEEVLHG